ncbi:hypothetical protein [Streptomyces sp. f150]|uniref:hypothetical protein n=1 Tax=Streptomyces sp. f150 TaxID=1827699 RepID=UPI0015CF5A10|nr:hypothetical protein [Streptomyces sp. f150]
MDDLTADRTPETHLSTLRIRGYLGTSLVGDKPAVYRFPKEPLPVNKLALAGTWTTEYEHFTAGPDARLAFTYRARNANLVLAGTGTGTGTGKVTVIVDGKVTKTINVSGSPTLHRLTDDNEVRTGPPRTAPGRGAGGVRLHPRMSRPLGASRAPLVMPRPIRTPEGSE